MKDYYIVRHNGKNFKVDERGWHHHMSYLQWLARIAYAEKIFLITLLSGLIIILGLVWIENAVSGIESDAYRRGYIEGQMNPVIIGEPIENILE